MFTPPPIGIYYNNREVREISINTRNQKYRQFTLEEISKIKDRNNKYSDLMKEIPISRMALRSKRYRLKKQGLQTPEVEPIAIAIMQDVNDHYYTNFADAYSSYVKDIIIAAKETSDITEIITGDFRTHPLRLALKTFYNNGGFLFTSKRNLIYKYQEQFDVYLDNPDNGVANYDASLVEDCIAYLEEVCYRLNRILSSVN